jgi:hypothetical protein
MHENRETSGAPRPEGERGRSAKAQSHTTDTHVLEESDRAIIARHSAGKSSVPGIERCTRSTPLRQRRIRTHLATEPRREAPGTVVRHFKLQEAASSEGEALVFADQRQNQDYCARVFFFRNASKPCFLSSFSIFAAESASLYGPASTR